jgi:hypothetical protein
LTSSTALLAYLKKDLSDVFSDSFSVGTFLDTVSVLDFFSVYTFLDTVSVLDSLSVDTFFDPVAVLNFF